MNPTCKPSALLTLTASAALLLAAICGVAALITYDAGNYKDAAEAAMFAAIFIFYPFACLIVATLQAQEATFREQYPDYVEE